MLIVLGFNQLHAQLCLQISDCLMWGDSSLIQCDGVRSKAIFSSNTVTKGVLPNSHIAHHTRSCSNDDSNSHDSRTKCSSSSSSSGGGGGGGDGGGGGGSGSSRSYCCSCCCGKVKMVVAVVMVIAEAG